MTAGWKRRRARLQAAGICIHCARCPVTDGYTRCVVCRGLLAAAQQRQKYERAKSDAAAGRMAKLHRLAEIVERKGREKSKYAA